MVTRRSPELHGREEAQHWLATLGLVAVPRWHCEVVLDATNAQFHLDVYAEEWGFAFHFGARSSWIRVTDIPFVHGRDELGLLAATPELRSIHGLIAELEAKYAITFSRADAVVRSNLSDATHVVRAWLADHRTFAGREDVPAWKR